MPIVFSGLVEVATALSTSDDLSNGTPFHFAAGTWIAAAIESSVLLVAVRMNMNASSFHGVTMPAAPKPNTKYASSAVIASCVLALGTTNTYGCTGPWKLPIPAGGGVCVQALTKTLEFATSTATPAGSITHWGD